MDVSFKHRAIEPIQTSQGSQRVNTFSSGRSWSPSVESQAVPVRTGGQIVIRHGKQRCDHPVLGGFPGSALMSSEVLTV